MKTMYSDDPLMDFEAWEAEEHDRLEERPVCSQCDEPIQEDFAYRINDELICEDCMEHFRISI